MDLEAENEKIFVFFVFAKLIKVQKVRFCAVHTTNCTIITNHHNLNEATRIKTEVQEDAKKHKLQKNTRIMTAFTITTCNTSQTEFYRI